MSKAKGWHPADILAAIKKKGETLTSLALKAGLHESACRTALVRPFPAADAVIAQFLAVPLHDLWPARYDLQGRRIDRRTIRERERSEATANSSVRHRLNDEAA